MLLGIFWFKLRCASNLTLRVQGLGFRVQGLGFRVQGLGFRVQGLGLRVEMVGSSIHGLDFRASSPVHTVATCQLRT